MKYVATVLLVLVVVGGARAIHPPMEPPPSPGTPASPSPPVHITSITPTVVPTPEPAGVTLAIFGLLGGGTYGLLRRKK
jgi:hypothetical protein